MRNLSNTKPYKELIELLMSVPGIGITIAMILGTEIGDISRFSSFDKFASYLGMTPTEHSSGARQRSGPMTKRGKLYIRAMIIEACWKAISKDKELYACYVKRLKTKSPQKAIVCVARKLLSRLYHVWRIQERYVVKAA